MLPFFLRRRVKYGNQPVNQYVQARAFIPGAEGMSYEPTTTTTPDFLTSVHPWLNFQPMGVYQPGMNLQVLALPPSLPVGFVYGGMQPSSLIDPDNYPDITGAFYQ